MTKKPIIRFKNYNEDWEQRKVKDIFRVTRGYVLAATKTVKDKSNLMPYPVYSSQTKDQGLMGYYNDYLYENAITWTTDGANAGTVNYREGKFYCTNVCGVLISEEGYANKMVSEALNQVAWKHVSKVGNPKLMNNVMSEVSITIPKNLEEQKEISTFINKIDNLITLHQRKLEALEKTKKSFLQKMFPKKDETKPEIRFAGYTDDWEQRKLGEIIQVNSGKDYKHLNEGEIPVYGTGGYMLSVDEALSYKDAIGLGRKGTINKPYLLKAPFWTVDTLFYSVPINNNDLSFIDTLFQNINWKKYDESTGVPSLSKNSIVKIEKKVPSIEEQEKIGLFFKKISETIALHQRQLEALEKMKKSFLQKMFI